MNPWIVLSDYDKYDSEYTKSTNDANTGNSPETRPCLQSSSPSWYPMSFSSYHWSSSSTGKFWWWCIVILGRISTVIMMVLQAWNMHSLVPVQQQKYKMFVLLCWFSWASGNFLWVSLLFADILWTGHFLKICLLMTDEMIAGTAHTARRGAGSMKNKLISESTMTSEFKSRLFSFLTFLSQFRDRRLHSWAW